MDNAPTLRQIFQTSLGLGLVSFSAWVAELGRPSDRWMALAGGIGGTACMVHAVFGKRNRSHRPSADGLDRVLLHWDEENVFTVRDLLNSASIYGRTGSGKTSSSGRAIAEAVVRLPSSGGLIIAAKPGEDRTFWEGVFAAAGRSDDLLIFSPDHSLRCNLLDYEMKQGGGHTRNITKTLCTISETLRSSDTDNRESSDFWQKEQERMLFNAVEVVKLATGGVSAPDLHRFISGAALTPTQFTSPEWLAGFHNQCMKRAWEAPKSTVTQHDYDLAKEYWLFEYPSGMADRTRASILTGVMGILHTFNTGIVRELVSTVTNVTPDDMFRGKYTLVDMPVSEHGDVGAFVSGGLKYLCQRAILRRKASESSNVAVIWADEAQGVVTSFDAPFLAQCRSHRGCMVFLSQSLPGYYAALGGETGKRSIDALMTNFGTKIFHALGDLDTAQWASGLVGRSLQTFTGGSMGQQDGVYDTLMGRSQYQANFSQSFESTLQAAAFLHGLKTGGPGAGFACDAYVIRTGEPFASGQNWLRTSFSQRPGR